MDGETKNSPRRPDRRHFLGLTATALASQLLASESAVAEPASGRVKAVAFDAFAIFDPGPVFRLTEQLFPGRGAELSSQWRTRQFEYTWLRNSLGRYADFWHVTEDALRYAAAQLNLSLTPAQRDRLMSSYLTLASWPDVMPVLTRLRQQGIRLALLSNLTPAMLQSCVKSSHLDGFFDLQLSTDRVQAFKPDPRTYNMGLETFALRREQVVFVAFAGWDAAGAKIFGYPTYWANRLHLPIEELGVRPDAIAKDLSELPAFIEDQT